MKTLAEVSAALQVRFEGEIKYVPGQGGKSYGYVPWDASLREALEVFGPDGFSVAVKEIKPMAEGVYMAIVVVTVFTEDGAPMVREGVGVGVISGDNGKAHDTAIKAAASDGFSRAMKLFGDRFGAFLYDKGDPAHEQGGNGGGYQQQRTAPARSQGQAPRQAPSGDRRPTEKQLPYLLKNGYSQAEVDAMPFSQWKATLDAIFAAPKGQFSRAEYEGGASSDSENWDDVPF